MMKCRDDGLHLVHFFESPFAEEIYMEVENSIFSLKVESGFLNLLWFNDHPIREDVRNLKLV